MYNYEHEILCPPDKAIATFLWFDYFHDSDLLNIDFCGTTVAMTYECSRDIEAKCSQLRGDQSSIREYVDAHIDEFIYSLTFKNVAYFHVERQDLGQDYLNGRFKDSALLHRVNSDKGKTHYHFRIQCDDGYIDIVFREFCIRKKKGNVRYSKDTSMYNTCSNSYRRVNIPDTVAELIHMSRNSDDFHRFLAMNKLWHMKCTDLLQISRENVMLPGEYEEAIFYSAYLLGKLGDESDLSALYSLLIHTMVEKSEYMGNSLLPKRNILDAIDSISYRCK